MGRLLVQLLLTFASFNTTAASSTSMPAERARFGSFTSPAVRGPFDGVTTSGILQKSFELQIFVNLFLEEIITSVWQMLG